MSLPAINAQTSIRCKWWCCLICCKHQNDADSRMKYIAKQNLPAEVQTLDTKTKLVRPVPRISLPNTTIIEDYVLDIRHYEVHRSREGSAINSIKVIQESPILG
jgi:hypothetical protein